MDARPNAASTPARLGLWPRVQAEWREWRSAWVWLPENPLVFYLGRTRRRADARIPLWQKLTLATVIAGLVLAALIMFWIDQQGSGGLLVSLLSVDVWVIMCASAIWLLYSLWAFEGLYSLVGDCMRLLALPGKRSVALQLDDMLALTQLSDRDILLALLRVALPPFLLRVLVGIVLMWLSLLMFQSELFTNLGAEGVWQTFILGPVTLAALAISGALASLLLALISVCLGRSLRPDSLVLSSSLLIGMSQGSWLLIGIGVLSTGGSSGGGVGMSPFVAALLALLGTLLAGFVLVSNIGLAGERAWWRSTMAAAWPTLLLGSGMIFMLVMLALWLDGSPPEWYPLLGWMYLYSWSGLAPLNPLAIPSLYCIGVPPQLTPDLSPDYDFISPGAYFFQLLLFQLVLAVIFLYMARRAVELRRHEGS